MSSIRFFRDSLTLDSNLLAKLTNAGLNPSPGDMLVLGAPQCTVTTLPGNYNYTIVADKVTLSSNPTLCGVAPNVSPSVTIYATDVEGDLVCCGAAGAPGAAGARGEDGTMMYNDLHKPIGLSPGTPGSNGGDGGPGSPGGKAIIYYCSATRPPTAAAPGGAGGSGGGGGIGGVGGQDRVRAKSGVSGRNGPSGPTGQSEVKQVSQDKIWASLESESQIEWAAYRTEVGGYLFRAYDSDSQLRGIEEFDAALQLDATNADAKILRKRLLQQQIPTGLPRDLDIAPDYKSLSSGLLNEIELLQNAFTQVVDEETQALVAEAARDQIGLVLNQLKVSLQKAQDDKQSAQDSQAIATAEASLLDSQINDVQKQIEASPTQGFSLGDLITTVGTVGGAITSIATGIGGIVSIPDSIAALGKFFTSGQGFKEVITSKKAGEELSNLKTDFDKIVSAGGKVDSAIVSFDNICAELEGASTKAAQAQMAQLLKQQAELTKERMIAGLREQQAADQVAGADRQIQQITDEINNAQRILSDWQTTEAFIEEAVGALISSARRLADFVAEDVFRARRALEIYELDNLDDLRFNYGYIHPDLDHDCSTVERIKRYIDSFNDLPVSFLTWNDVYQDLNAGATGFDVVHPVVPVCISDPSALGQFENGGKLQFSIAAGSIPACFSEVKVASLTIELDGASAPSPNMIWVEHLGHWTMVRRPKASKSSAPIVEFCLFPKKEVFNLNVNSNALTGSIPENSAAAAEPGPPFSFWGRGVIADWRIWPVTPNSLDLRKLSQIKVTFTCIALAQQGAPRPPSIRPHTISVKVIPPIPPIRKLVLVDH